MSISNASETGSKPRGWRRGALRLIGLAALGIVLLLVTVWAVAALYFDVRVSGLRGPLAAGYALAVVAIWIFVKRRWPPLR
jgi:hypothetical protein